jgi:hypothetical protein
MVFHGCESCGRRGGTLFRFVAPGGGAAQAAAAPPPPPVCVCARCAHEDVRYAHVCKTDAKRDFRLDDADLAPLRCAFTDNPYDRGCVLLCAASVLFCAR